MIKNLMFPNPNGTSPLHPNSLIRKNGPFNENNRILLINPSILTTKLQKKTDQKNI